MTWLPSLACNKAKNTFADGISMNHHCSVQCLLWRYPVTDRPSHRHPPLDDSTAPGLLACSVTLTAVILLAMLVNQSLCLFFPCAECVALRSEGLVYFFMQWGCLPALLAMENRKPGGLSSRIKANAVSQPPSLHLFHFTAHLRDMAWQETWRRTPSLHPLLHMAFIRSKRTWVKAYF